MFTGPLLVPLCVFVCLLQFGDSQQLRMVRILRSTLMVRVGGGWTALDEFLVKNDPCRGQFVQTVARCCCCILFTLPAVFHTVKGRTNLKIKEKYLSPAGSSSKGLTVSRSNSSLSLYSSASAPTSPLTRKVRQNYHHPGWEYSFWVSIKRLFFSSNLKISQKCS